MRQWSDRKKMVELPLLKGYVFIHMLPNQQEKVLQTRGVVNFVRCEGKTAVIRDHEIERLKQLVDLGYHMEADVIRRNYSEGDKVKIRSGVLKGLEGFVYSKGDQKLIEVVLTSIGQCIRIKLPKELLQEI